MSKQEIIVIALDFEGTLISNAVSQIPRPGLYSFLENCQNKFPRIVIFTAVKEKHFRNIATTLIEQKKVPSWFGELEYIEWNLQYKDLRFIPNVNPSQVVLIDDREEYVHPDWKNRWIQIQGYDFPYSQSDRELEKVMEKLSCFSLY